MSITLQKRAMPWQLSIQVRLILVALFFAAVPAIIVARRAFIQAQSILLDEFGTTAQQITLQTGEDTQRFNQAGMDDAKFIAQFPVWNQDLQGDNVSVQQQGTFLRSLVKNDPLFNSIYISDGAGNVIVSSNNDFDNQSSQTWFQKAIQGETFASQVYVSSSARIPVITYSSPITNSNGKIVGVVAINVAAQKLFDILASRPLGKTGDVFMVNRQGLIIADPIAHEVFNDVSNLVPVQAALRGETGTVVDVDPDTGRTSLFTYAPIPGVQDWVAIGQVPIEELTEPINDLALRMALVVVVATVVVGIIILLVTRAIVRPLEQLTKAAQQLGEGHYETAISVTGKDEIGQLATAFRQMTGDIQKRDQQLLELVTALEQRVVETQLAREQAERSDQVKSAFLASMSHELRTPLNSVINFTKFVVKGVMGPVTERQTETLNKVVDSAKHLLNLINDVLDMSKIESGSLNLFVEENVDLKDILQKVTSTAEALIGEKSVELHLDVDNTLPPVTGDKQRIRQIMLNIVSNACKFTEQGSIRVSATSHDNEVQIMVKDTGPGIQAGDAAAVFEPFKQTETGLRKGEGTGLGMPISRSLAEAHGGRLWFESTPGQGTTFYVTLPVKSNELVLSLA